MNDPAYLSIPEVLARTGMARSTYYDRRARGDFPATVQLGLASRVHERTAVEKWIKDNAKR